jgi:outer membrane protein assembly factor BamB
MKQILVFVSLLMFGSVTWALDEANWEQELGSDYVWSQVTEMGTLLVSTEKSLLNIKPEDGSILWQREDMAELAPFNVNPIVGTPLIIVNEFEGTIPPKARLQVIDMITGKNLWDTGVIKGANLGAVPVPEHNLVLYGIQYHVVPEGENRKDLKPGSYVTAFAMDSGEVVYDSRQDHLDKATRHISDSTGGWIPDTDLSGHPMPVVEDGIIYLPYTGLTAINLETGETLWHTSFKTAHPSYKLTNARPIIKDDVIYTSGDGHILAVNKKSGEILWDTKVGRKYAIPELLVIDDQVVGRIGGTFSTGKDLAQLKPFGVVALNRADGSERWLWKKGKDGMTNMVHQAERGWIVVADRQNMYALDLAANKKPVIAEEMELEFKREMGTTEMAAKGMTIGSGLLSGGLMGGIQGGLKAMDTSGQEDPPTDISLVGGDLVVRGQFHLLSYDPDTDGIEYSIAFAPPGVNGLALAAMGAVTALNTLGNTGLHSGWSTRNVALGNALNVSSAFEGEVSKRYAAAEKADNLGFFLTTAEEGMQLMGINLDSGEEVGAVPMKEKEPQFQVDSLSNTVYYIRDSSVVTSHSF